jgi:glutamate racemase
VLVADGAGANRRASKPNRPIGVFDSGVGGLTVAAALRELLPAEDIFYLGDTARVPYGGKSAATIERYSMEISGLLLAENAKLIVVACNTASALAVPRLQETLRVPVIGVIEPGARAAVSATKTGQVGVIGTRATVYSRAYERAIHALKDGIHVHSQPCPLLVPLIEEGWLDDPITQQIIKRYVERLLKEGIDTLVLGCTHYPLLKPLLAAVLGREVRLIDSAEQTAAETGRLLDDNDLRAPVGASPSHRFIASDAPEQFLRLGQRFLGAAIDRVETLTLG